ncbi:uncharacterized protein LOC141620191 [Silene latifolia]|uniref:uncharacterized protein LOC141620191 n=1 Tax=Silene latifolia TaxID=37657 RepID=UPI003D7863AD
MDQPSSSFSGIPNSADAKALVVQDASEIGSEVDSGKDGLKFVIRLCGLGLKFWGEKCLAKLASLLGKYVKADNATLDKTRLGYARLMVEVQVGQEFPDKMFFNDEHGQQQSVMVKYEWKPLLCTLCKGIGHHQSMYRKNAPIVPKVVHVWRPVAKPTKPPTGPSPTVSANPVPEVNQVVHIIWRVVTAEVSYAAVLTSPPASPTKSPEVEDINSGENFWFTVVYGSNSDTDRIQLWQELGELEDFRQCVQYCELMHIQAQGSFYTWNNKQAPTSRVFSRIDRFLINHEWLTLYPDPYAYFLNEGLFDHNPCICYRRMERSIRKIHFRYFNMWGQASEFPGIIKNEWERSINGCKMFQVTSKLKSLKKPLKLLNRTKFYDIEKAADLAKLLLDNIQTKLHQNPIDHFLMEAEQSATKNYAVLQKSQMSFLRQKAKAPGLDGYSSQFFKDAWPIIGTEVCNAIQYFFIIGNLLKQVNATIVSLIPKVEHPTTVLEFRPIACCNTLYKCIAKLLYNRLGEILPDIVSPNQGGFVKGRNIIENVLICQDLVRLYNRKSASSRCLIKIDLRKAYDTVEWPFLLSMLQALNFSQAFIDNIMTCVTTTAYSLSLNGSSFGFFQGKRGLRQGDPLSPLLFSLCMEYLSRILNVVSEQEDFRFIPLCGSIRLNHHLFADDLLLFSKGTPSSIMWILRAFSTFSNASGLCLNKDKSDIYFNGVTSEAMRDILQVSGFRKGSLPFKYLEVPISSKKLSKNERMQLTDRICSRIRS